MSYNKKMIPPFKNILIALALSFYCLTMTSSVAEAMKIIPQRLVISPDTKIEYLFIKNSSNETESYSFAWKHMAMDKEGNVINLDKVGRNQVPEYKAADDIVRFSPRRATLKPGETQRITMMMRRTPDTPDGEYRSHFLVQREADGAPDTETIVESSPAATDKEAETTETTSTGEKTASVVVNVRVSRAVPIYVLNGETNASLTLLSASLKPNPDQKTKNAPKYLLDFRVQKKGNRSVIGNADVHCKTTTGDQQINKVTKAFAVYAEGEFRNEQMAIDLPEGGCSDMRLVIKGNPYDVLKGQILGEMAVKR